MAQSADILDAQAHRLELRLKHDRVTRPNAAPQRRLSGGNRSHRTGLGPFVPRQQGSIAGASISGHIREPVRRLPGRICEGVVQPVLRQPRYASCRRTWKVGPPPESRPKRTAADGVPPDRLPGRPSLRCPRQSAVRLRVADKTGDNQPPVPALPLGLRIVNCAAARGNNAPHERPRTDGLFRAPLLPLRRHRRPQ